MLGRRRGLRTSAIAAVVLTVAGSAASLAETQTYLAPELRGFTRGATAGSTQIKLGTPTNARSGDVLVAALTVRAAGSAPIAAPAGWTLVRRDATGSGAGALSQAVYYRVAGAAEPASYGWSWGGVAAATGAIVAYGHMDASAPIGAHGGRAVLGSRRVSAPSVTTTRTNEVVAAFFGSASGRSLSTPSGLTMVYTSTVRTTKITGSSSLGNVAVVPTPSSTGEYRSEQSGGNSATMIGQVVTLRPGVPVVDSPTNVSRPSVSGTPREGETLVASTGTWTSTVAVSHSFQWRRCATTGGCVDVSQATSATHNATAADIGAVILVRVTASNAGGSSSADSAPTAVVGPPTTSPPSAPTSQDFLHPFPAGSIWADSPLPLQPEVDPRSSDMISYWLGLVRSPNMPLRAYANATAVATATSPLYSVFCTIYSCGSMSDFGPVPIPTGTRPDPAGDGHLAVWDPVTHREWDFWISNCPTTCASTGSGGAIDLDTPNPQMRNGSANAASWPLMAGIVRPEEIAAGEIRHPLVFATPGPKSTWVCPAVHTGGSNSDPRALPAGALLQLDPTIKVAELGLPGWQQTIARALQRYGMYAVDGTSGGANPGTLDIGAENPLNRGDLWARVGLSGSAAGFSSNFPWSRMRVLMPPKPWC